MKKITTGILAHVDSGKTTLSEGLLYVSGNIRKHGRVDHKNTFLDTNEIERDRGITIFSKQAVLSLKNSEITLLDTPGHVDFSSETERTLQVLDYIIMVISGTDGVQSHTETLWSLAKSHGIPVFIFVNKMDISNYTKDALVHNLKNKLDDSITDFTKDLTSDEFMEDISMCSEKIMNSFLENGKAKKEDIMEAIEKRQLFPCFFGSALKLEGVSEFLNVFDEYTKMPKLKNDFGAKVFKISRDEQNNRLTYIKVTGGSLKVREILKGTDLKGEEWEEKVNSIRIYSGEKFKTADEVPQGTVCTLSGLTKTYPGEGLGSEENSSSLTLEPVFSYRVQINDNTDIHTVISNLLKLEEEETQLHILWNEQLKEIRIELMGEVQSEILKRIIKERFNMDVDFVQGGIIYRETVKEPVIGIGHYEPLRHYSEVHLLIEPNEQGKGVEFDSKISEDDLSKNWQRLILTHLKEKTHLGVLTGSPLTDVKITLINGRAHLKHTEGGDFRQATYRAVRHGLMYAENVLLEPWYDFTLEVPTENVGRAMTDVQQMGGTVSPVETGEDYSVLKGSAPVIKMRDYQKEVTVYTKGKGHIFLKLSGYKPCPDAEKIVEEINYNPEQDLENTPDSVFCSHGAGFTVKWDEVKDYAHLESSLEEKNEEQQEIVPIKKQYSKIIADEEELISIFEKTYGKIERKLQNKLRPAKQPVPEKYKKPPKVYEKNYLLVDGYNIIFASDELKEISKSNLEHARYTLIDMLSTYNIIKPCELILVFDAYKVKGNRGEVEKINGISVVYTKEAETADAYIEKVTHELSKNNRVRVATSDGLEQLIILGSGALRVPASSFLKELSDAKKELEKLIEETNKN